MVTIASPTATGRLPKHGDPARPAVAPYQEALRTDSAIGRDRRARRILEHPDSSPPRHARRAFSLVELLVVVAMIMFLLALLMPALRSARDRAKAVVCFSNLREIYAAFAGYAAMFDDKYPITGDSYYYLYGTRGQSWWHWLGKGGGFFGKMEQYNGPTFGYNQTRWPVLRDPAEPGSRRVGEHVFGQTYYDSELCGSSYYMNWSISRYCYYIGYCPCEMWFNCDPTQYPFRKGFSAGPDSGKPAEAWFVMDGIDQGHWWALPSISWTLDNDDYYPFYHDYSFRHPGERAHFLYLDGHTGTAQAHYRTGSNIWYQIYAASPP